MKKTVKRQKKIPVQFHDETKVHPALSEYFGYCLFKASARLRALMDLALEAHQIQTHHLGILKILELKDTNPSFNKISKRKEYTIKF